MIEAWHVPCQAIFNVAVIISPFIMAVTVIVVLISDLQFIVTHFRNNLPKNIIFSV